MAARASPVPALALVDAGGRRVTLGPQLAQGGEGSIYPVTDRPDLVAKIYHTPVSPEKAAKLAAMVRLSSDRLRRLTAWPLDTLHDRSSGAVRGFLMPWIRDYHDVHILYGPKTRLREFPDASLPFLVHAAANLARLFAVIHEHGHVIGDVNHGNVRVSRQATTRLVDCDSLQIHDGPQCYFCTVGVPTHTPPELQGKSFAGLIRTPNHDAFGLAVLIFQLLLVGCHPFAGTFLGAGEPQLERNIEEYRFAYGSGAAKRQMRPPPFAPGFEVATPPVVALFERAFTRAGAEPPLRPTAREWANALTEAEKQLIVCTRHSGHHYPRSLAACPWCAIEPRIGMAFFNVEPLRAGATHTNRPFALEIVWAQIAAVPDPGPAPPLPSPTALPIIPATAVAAQPIAPPTPATAVAAQPVAPQPQEEQRWAKAMRVTAITAVAIGLFSWSFGALGAGMVAGWLAALALALGAIAGVIYYRIRRTRNAAARVTHTRTIQEAQAQVREAEQRRLVLQARMRAAEQRRLKLQTQARAAEQRWYTDAGNATFLAKRRELERQRNAYHQLAAVRQRKVQELATNQRQRQLKQFLDRHRIAAASIANIGAGRTATLQSYGIETAADVTREAILQVPSFGPTLADSLLAWRRSIEARFIFDPRRSIDPADLAAVDREIAASHARLERALCEGPAQLQRVAQQIVATRTTLRPTVEQARAALAQAEADLRAL